MFHKRSTNVPQTFRYLIGMKQKTIKYLLSRICLTVSKGDPFYLAQENRFWTKSKQSVFNQRNLGTIPKLFGFVSKTILERLSFRFWHYYYVAERRAREADLERGGRRLLLRHHPEDLAELCALTGGDHQACGAARAHHRPHEGDVLHVGGVEGGGRITRRPCAQGFGSVSGSALIWVAGSGSRFAFKYRIRIQIQEGKNDPQK